MKNHLNILFLLLVFVSSCSRSEDFLLDSLTQTQIHGISYLDLRIGVSTIEDVTRVMNSSPDLDGEFEPNPVISSYTGREPISVVSYRYNLKPEINYDIDFYFNDNNQLTEIEISLLKNLTIEEFIQKFGEPSYVLFRVHKRHSQSTCALTLYYDEIQTIVAFGIRGNANQQRCMISPRNEPHTILFLTYYEYAQRDKGQLSKWEIDGKPEDFIHPWKGYGNLFNLYPQYPVLEYYAYD
jgi:hypothetical protein